MGELARQLGTDAVDTSFVDVLEAESLVAFCARCSVVVDCSGPFSQIGARVALAALGTGAGYVAAAGDERLRGTLLSLHKTVEPCSSALCAGMLPGLSGLLPRVLAAGFDECHALRAFVGMLDRFTAGAAADFVAGLEGSESLAAWRGGRKASRALTRIHDLSLPFFFGRVTAHPYLNHEGERLARLLNLDSADWFNVFEGSQVLAAMSRVGHAGVTLEHARGGRCGRRSRRGSPAKRSGVRSCLLRAVPPPRATRLCPAGASLE